MSYSLQSLRGQLFHRWPLPPTSKTPGFQTVLDVRRFGIGYWIGAVCNSVLAVVWIMTPPSRRLTVSTIVAGVTLQVFLVGMLISLAEISSGARYQDRNRVVGGTIGLALCAIPCILYFLFLVLSPALGFTPH